MHRHVHGDSRCSGRCDIAGIWNDGGSPTFAVFRSTGLQFAPHTQWKTRDGGWDDSIQWVAGDYDADGFADIELLKRRTGAGTGPCQGKLCHGEMLACLAEAGRPVALPTVRPLLRPTSLAALAAADSAS